MASWVSVQLDTTPPVLVPNVPSYTADNTTLVIPFTLSDGTVEGVLDLPVGGTVNGTIVGSTMEFVIPDGEEGVGQITFTVVDDVLNEDEIVDTIAISVIPSPHHQGILGVVEQNGRFTGIVTFNGLTAAEQINFNTGAVEEQILTGVLVEETITGGVEKHDVPAPVDQVPTRGVVPWEPVRAVITEEVFTGAVNQVSRGVAEQGPVPGVIVLRDGVLTNVISTIPSKGVVEPPPRQTGIVEFSGATGALEEKSETGAVAA